MQSKTSFFNLALFKKNIARTWIVGLLYFIILTIMNPIIFVINLAGFNEWYKDSGFTKEMMLYMHLNSQVTGVMTGVISIVVTGITFWYLFFKRDNYMMHSFPVSRKSLFFTGMISSYVITLVPVVLTGVTMSIVALSEHAYAFDAIWYWVLICIVSTMIFTSIALFSLMSSGQIVTAILFYGIFNYLYGLMEVAFRLTSQLLMFGLGETMLHMEYSPLTPILFIDSAVKTNCNYKYNDLGMLKEFTYVLQGGKYLAIYAVASIVITGIAYILYKNKKLETVNDFITVPFLKPVFTVGISFFVSMVAGAFVASMVNAVATLRYSTRFGIAIFSTIIIGVILFYATQMLIEKTVRVFSAQKFVFMVGYSFVALGMMICLRCDVFNIEDYVPKAQDISWIGIDSTYTMVFTDEEDINSIRELHKNFLEDKKELRDINVDCKDVPGSTLTFKYKLKNGKQVVRTYSVVDTESNQVSATYLAATEPILDYLNNPTRIKEHVIGNIWDDCTITAMTFYNYFFSEESRSFVTNTAGFDNLSEREQNEKYNRVYEAVLKDIDEGKILKTSFGDNYSYDNGNNLYNDFSFVAKNDSVPYISESDVYWDPQYESDPIYERDVYVTLTTDCKNTLKALKEEGFIFDDNGVITYEEYQRICKMYNL